MSAVFNMNRWVKSLAVLVGVLVLLFVILVVYVNQFAKSAIERQASAMLRRSVTVEGVRFVFPWTLRLTGLQIEDLLQARQANLPGALVYVSGSSLHLPKVVLIDPVLTLHRTSDQHIIWAEHYEEAPTDGLAKSVRVSQLKTVIDTLTVTHGRLHFPSPGQNEGEFSLSEVDLSAQHVPLSGQAMDVAFDVAGKVDGAGVPFAGDHFKGGGWFNWPQRNMNATFRVINPQGKIDVEVNLDAKHNDLMVRGHVKTRRMTLKASDDKDTAVEHLLLESMQSAGMELDLDFSFPTKLDRWELRNIDFSGNLNASDEGKTQAEKMRDLKNIGREVKTLIEQNKK